MSQSVRICIPCNVNNILNHGQNETCFILKQLNTQYGRCAKCGSHLFNESKVVTDSLNKIAEVIGHLGSLKCPSDSEINPAPNLQTEELKEFISKELMVHTEAHQLAFANLFKCFANFWENVAKAWGAKQSSQETWMQFIQSVSGRTKTPPKKKDPCWECRPIWKDIPNSEIIGYKVVWTEPGENGKYIQTGFYIACENRDLGWCQFAAESQAKRMNEQKKCPWEYYDQNPDFRATDEQSVEWGKKLAARS